MAANPKQITVLVVDDDEDDRLLIHEAFVECCFGIDLRFVEDGEALLDYLHQRGNYQCDPYPCDSYRERKVAPRPSLILLDLNMPKKDGREALREIKTHPNWRSIPIVVLTTSQTDKDICQSYDLGANSYIAKPATFDALVQMLKTLGKYWFEIVELPCK